MSPGQMENPFPGLRSFTADESHLFFGREGQCDEVLRKMGRGRFVAVVGVSGCGKSSLVRAGLLPSLYNGYLATAGADWRIADLRPGGDPIGNLAAALTSTGFWDDGLDADALHVSSLALVSAARKARQSGQWAEEENLLILADQFEELFRYPVSQESAMADRDEKAAFVKLLLEAAAQKELPIYVIITMRSDFLGDCAQFRDLPEAINDGQYLIPRMTREQRRSALEAPVRVAGGAIAPRLVQRILNDAGEDPGQLPVMQHALMRTWDHWRSRGQNRAAMDIEDYEAIGTMAQALSTHADEAYLEAVDKLGARGEEIVRRIFQRLRERDANGREVRRPTPLAELCAVAEAPRDEVLGALECFRRLGRTFIMPPASVRLAAGSSLDVTHECLLRQWERLVGWVNEELESRRIYQRLADRAEEQESSDNPDFLKGTLLQVALDWWDRRQPCRAWAERYHPGFAAAERFLQASRRNRDAERLRAEEARRQEEERRLADASREQQEKEARIRAQAETHERELKKRGAYIMAGLALAAALISGAFGFNTLQQMKRASAEQQRASAEQQRATDLEKTNERLTQAALDESQKDAESVRQQARLLEAAVELQEKTAEELRQANRANDMAARAIASEARNSEDAARMALDAFASMSRMHKPPTLPILDALHQSADAWRLKLAIPLSVRQLSFSPDGAYLITVGEDGSLKRWDSFGSGDPHLMPGAEKGFPNAAFSANGEMVIGGENGTLRIARTNSPKFAHSHEFPVSPGNAISAVAFSPDGRQIAYTSGADKCVHLLDRQSGTELREQEFLDITTVRSLAFSPNGLRLAYGGDRDPAKARAGGVVVWDVDAGSQAAANLPLNVNTVAFSGDGAFLGATDDHTVILLNSATRSVLRSWEEPQGIAGMAFSPDTTPESVRLLTAGVDGNVKIWNSNGQLLTTLMAHGGAVRAVAFSPDGRRVASAGQDSVTRIWDTGPTRELYTFEAHSNSVQALAVSGNRLLTGSLDRSARLWDLTSRKQVLNLDHGESVLAAAFADDSIVATAGLGWLRTWSATPPGTALKRWPLSNPSCEKFSDDGSLLAAGYRGSVTVWEVASGKPVFKMDTKVSPVAVALSHDKKKLAWAGQDRRVRVLRRDSPQDVWEVASRHSADIKDIAFSPDGKRLATASLDKNALLWNLETQKFVVLQGHGGGLSQVVFDTHGDRLATASIDGGAVQIWDLRTESPLVSMAGHVGKVFGVVMTDHQQVITAGADRTVRIFTLDPRELAALVLDRVVHVSGKRESDSALWKDLGVELDRLKGVTTQEDNGLRVAGLQRHAETLARVNLVSDALTAFDAARKIDPSIPDDFRQKAQVIADTIRVDTLIEQGSDFARAGDQVKAIAALKDAVELDSHLKVSQSAKTKAVQLWLGQGRAQLARAQQSAAQTNSGDLLAKAQQALDAAAELNPQAVSPLDWNRLCAAGTQAGLVSQVKGACQKGECYGLVQNKIAWDYQSHKDWSEVNVERLCAGSPKPTEPPQCFEQAMHGKIERGGGTAWTWPDALSLCAGTNDAARTIGCFQGRIAQGDKLAAAVVACKTPLAQ